MNNKIKSKTRLTAIQILAQQLVNKEDIQTIKDDFNKNYLNTSIDNTSEIIKYNVNFLTKIINYYKKIEKNKISEKINSLIKFNRKFEKWDTINQAIVLISYSEIINTEEKKMKIILNDYIEISKYFVDLKDTKLINSILDKLINEKK
tara:strand:- start:1610 stop:2053 length:444 start_codon:yes stop_codon:yes gene_type:complete